MDNFLKAYTIRASSLTATIETEFNSFYSDGFFIHIGTINMNLTISYFKLAHIKIYILYIYIFLSLKLNIV